MTAKWDVVLVEPTELDILNPTDEQLQATTEDCADEASARTMYAEKMHIAQNQRYTAVQLRCDGRILEQWPPAR